MNGNEIETIRISRALSEAIGVVDSFKDELKRKLTAAVEEDVREWVGKHGIVPARVTVKVTRVSRDGLSIEAEGPGVFNFRSEADVELS